MEIGIFDFETSGFYADNSIILCCSSKAYKLPTITTIRADRYKTWKTNKTNEKLVVEAISKELDKYDILIAHNGQWFDKGFFNAKCLEYGVKPVLRWKKLIDPVLIARRHMRLGRNSLTAIIDYLQVPTHKTPIELNEWRKASHNSDIKSMNKIVLHCEKDIIALEEVYAKMRLLVDRIDNQGSSR